TASSGLTEDEIRKATQSNEDWMLAQKEDPEFQDRKTRAEELFREFEALWPRLTRAAQNGLGQEPLQRAQAALSVARLQLAAREFLRSALERIHAVMAPGGRATAPNGSAPHPWLPSQPAAAAPATPAAAPAPRQAAKPAAPDPKAKKAKPGATPGQRPPPAANPPAPPKSPWDDGPSLAIPQPETGDSGGGAWSIHAETLPSASVSDDETDVWMRGARELVALNDFSGALELLNKLLQRKANDKDALQLYEVCEHNLTLMYESKIGSMDARPRTAIPPDEIIWLNLDPRAGFVLAQIDGEVSFDDLYAICGPQVLDTARLLCVRR